MSYLLEFSNPWLLKGQDVNQTYITMPQAVEGRRPIDPLVLYSKRIPGSKYFKKPSAIYHATYTVEGAFKGTCIIQVNNSSNPTEEGWEDLPDTFQLFEGFETSGSSGMSGGFDSAVSKPSKTIMKVFEGEYSWVRAKITVQRGTMRAININY